MIMIIYFDFLKLKFNWLNLNFELISLKFIFTNFKLASLNNLKYFNYVLVSFYTLSFFFLVDLNYPLNHLLLALAIQFMFSIPKYS